MIILLNKYLSCKFMKEQMEIEYLSIMKIMFSYIKSQLSLYKNILIGIKKIHMNLNLVVMVNKFLLKFLVLL